jgi:RNA polymerase sigma-32 factor
MSKKKSNPKPQDVIEIKANSTKSVDFDETSNESSPESTEDSEIEFEEEAGFQPEDDQFPIAKSHELKLQAEGLVISDPLKRYLHEIRNTPSLTDEEELQLAKRMHEKGDRDAAKKLVSANLKTVVRIAYEYRSMYHNLMDLIQEGNLGLMKAVSKYDPTKGARLSYYATWWVRSYILKYLLDNFRLVRVGTSQAQKKLFYHLMREKQRLEAQGIVAGPKLLAERLDVREKDVIEMEQRLLSPSAEVSLDLPQFSDDPKTALIGQLIDPKDNPDLTLEHQEWLTILREAIPELMKQLNEKEVVILQTRILSDEPKTLQEVADQYGLTRERVRQLEARVIDRLKKLVASRLDS